MLYNITDRTKQELEKIHLFRKHAERLRFPQKVAVCKTETESKTNVH